MATTRERMTSLHLAHLAGRVLKQQGLGTQPALSVTSDPISVLTIAVSFPEIPCHSPFLAGDQDTEETRIQPCKTSSFDHDNNSFRRVITEHLTFEDRACYGRNRSESL